MVTSLAVFDAQGDMSSHAPVPMPRRRSKPEPVAEIFGRAVRSRREEQGWTLEQLGERMGRPDGKYLGEVERGFHSPTITTAKQIADALDVTLAELVRAI